MARYTKSDRAFLYGRAIKLNADAAEYDSVADELVERLAPDLARSFRSLAETANQLARGCRAAGDSAE